MRKFGIRWVEYYFSCRVVGRGRFLVAVKVVLCSGTV